MRLEDDLVYLKILLFTFASSFFIKRATNQWRDGLSALLGLAVVWAVGGWQLFYSLVLVCCNLAVIKLVPGKHTALCSFAFCFIYLTFVRLAHWPFMGGFPKCLPHMNAVQLVMTLRCVGLAFELQDQRQRKADVETTKLDTSIYRLFCYCYNLVSLFTGPYYTYRVHQDMVRCKYLSQTSFGSVVMSRLLAIPPMITFFLILKAMCPLEDAHDESFYETNSFLTCLFYSTPVFAFTRVRCYIAWMLSEAACMGAGIGAYPVESVPKIGSGPSVVDALKKYEQLDNIDSTVECDYETIRNIDVNGCEFSTTFRDSMRCWNRSVQYWLATYVYRRFPVRSARTAVTMLVSAYWHGVHAGYYLSFMTIPFCLLAEDLAFATVEGDQKKAPKSNERFRLYWWFFRMRGFEYMVMGFLLLSWSSTIRYWRSTYFAFHTALIVIIVACLIKRHLFSSKVKEEKAE